MYEVELYVYRKKLLSQVALWWGFICDTHFLNLLKRHLQLWGVT